VSYDDGRADRACAELTKFGDHQHVNADFPNRYYQIAVAGRMVALLKKETAEGEEPEARPIGCGNIVRRLIIHGVLANDFAGPAPKAFAPYQVAIGTTGASHQLCFGMRELIERFPELAPYKLDLYNAFNRFHRCEVGELSEHCYEVKPLRPLMIKFLGQIAPLVLDGAVDGDLFAPFGSAEGGQQGDPLTGLFFCLWFHNHLKFAQRFLRGEALLPSEVEHLQVAIRELLEQGR
jgi:hypothetical protein